MAATALRDCVPPRILHGLTAAQRAAVMSDDQPLCVLAGAGSGKTTVLTARVARRLLDGSARPEHALVVTFTRKAAGELRHRLARHAVPGRIWAGTFHAAALAQLRRHWADRAIRPAPVTDDPRRLLQAAGGDALADPVLAGVAAEVHWAQVHMVAPATYADEACAAGRRGPGGLTLADVADLYGRYEQEKARRGVLDLDDLVTRAAALFESDAEACAALRWRLHHLFVDEFQDLNPAQWRLLMAWLGDRSDLFVVGDPNQAIYAWNGSDPSLLQRLPDNLPGTVVVRLDDNHRCTPQICAAARAVLGSDEATCRASRPDGQSPVIKEFDDDAAEASAVAHWLRLSRRPGGPWSHLAVLARTHARLAPVADALRGAGIPFRWAGAPGESGGRDDGTHSGALARLRRQPRARRVRSALAELVVADDVEACRDAHHGASSRRGGRALARLVDEHALELPDATVGDFLAWVAATGVSLPGADADEFGDGDADRYDDGDRYDDRKEQPDNVASHERVAGIGGVELSTFHRAKGLQWPAVAVVGLERGLMPIAYASTPDAWAEERRLLYVAITRAEDDLWCSWARTRHAEDRSWDCDESPFLDALSSAVDREPVRKAGTAGVSRHLRLLRARLASTG